MKSAAILFVLGFNYFVGVYFAVGLKASF